MKWNSAVPSPVSSFTTGAVRGVSASLRGTAPSSSLRPRHLTQLHLEFLNTAGGHGQQHSPTQSHSHKRAAQKSNNNNSKKREAGDVHQSSRTRREGTGTSSWRCSCSVPARVRDDPVDEVGGRGAELRRTDAELRGWELPAERAGRPVGVLIEEKKRPGHRRGRGRRRTAEPSWPHGAAESPASGNKSQAKPSPQGS